MDITDIVFRASAAGHGDAAAQAHTSVIAPLESSAWKVLRDTSAAASESIRECKVRKA